VMLGHASQALLVAPTPGPLRESHHRRQHLTEQSVTKSCVIVRCKLTHDKAPVGRFDVLVPLQAMFALALFQPGQSAADRGWLVHTSANAP
jgi:hypothetical protein